MKRHGFSLIELLVVIAVIAALMAILLPSLGAARDRAKSVACMSNLRQLSTAAGNYAPFNDGLFPLARDTTSDWDFAVVTDTAGNQQLVPGILWQANATPGAGGTSAAMKVQQCPSYTGRSATPTDPYTGYNYNTTFVGKGVGETITRPARLAEFRKPAATALFGDGGYYGGATDKFMRAPELYPQSPDAISPSARAAGTQAYRHRSATNVAFADNHAEPWHDRSAAGISLVTPTTGFLADTNDPYKVQ